jgi:hypothetical protein
MSPAGLPNFELRATVRGGVRVHAMTMELRTACGREIARPVLSDYPVDCPACVAALAARDAAAEGWEWPDGVVSGRA